MGNIYLPNPIDKNGQDIQLEGHKLAIQVETNNREELNIQQELLDGLHLNTIRGAMLEQEKNKNGKFELEPEQQLEQVRHMHNALVGNYQEHKEAVLDELNGQIQEMSTMQGMSETDAFNKNLLEFRNDVEALQEYDYQAQALEMESLDLDDDMMPLGDPLETRAR